MVLTFPSLISLVFPVSPNQVVYTITTTTTTIPIVSAVSIPGVTLPAEATAKKNFLDVLRDTIKAMIESGLAAGQSVSSLTITSVGGESVRHLRSFTRHLLSDDSIVFRATIKHMTTTTSSPNGSSSSSPASTLQSTNIASAVYAAVSKSVETGGASKFLHENAKKFEMDLSTLRVWPLTFFVHLTFALLQ